MFLYFDGQLIEMFNDRASADEYLQDCIEAWEEMTEADRKEALEWEDVSMTKITAMYEIKEWSK